MKALEETGRVAIAKIVIRNKQHLACVRPVGKTLVLETMYYADEVRQPEDAPAPQVRPAEVEMAKSLIENLAATWDPKRTTTVPQPAARPAREEGGGRAAAGAASRRPAAR